MTGIPQALCGIPITHIADPGILFEPSDLEARD